MNTSVPSPARVRERERDGKRERDAKEERELHGGHWVSRHIRYHRSSFWGRWPPPSHRAAHTEATPAGVERVFSHMSTDVCIYACACEHSRAWGAGCLSSCLFRQVATEKACARVWEGGGVLWRRFTLEDTDSENNEGEGTKR